MILTYAAEVVMNRRNLIYVILAGVILPVMPSEAQPQPLPQTARQALIEMFFGKTPGAFQKHLPEATKDVIFKAGPGPAAAMLRDFSSFGATMSAAGQHVQTFDAGSTLLLIEDSRTQSKAEITIERDDLRGDEDEIELSIKTSRNGLSEFKGVMPRFVLLMKQEANVWRLNQITLSVSVALADPEFLKGITDSMKKSAAVTGPISANQTAVISDFRTILVAESRYASTYPGQGFTCSLSDLDGFGGGEPNEHQAMLIESRLASGKKSGYTFALSGCQGSPVARFELTAVPTTGPGTGKSYCATQDGEVRYALDGTAASCWKAERTIE
jgi:hypothetical protein